MNNIIMQINRIKCKNINIQSRPRTVVTVRKEVIEKTIGMQQLYFVSAFLYCCQSTKKDRKSDKKKMFCKNAPP